MSIPFQVATVDKANFKSIYDGIKTNMTLRDETFLMGSKTYQQLDGLSSKNSPRKGNKILNPKQMTFGDILKFDLDTPSM